MWASSQDAVATTATTVNVETGSAFVVEAVLAAIFVAVILKATTSEGSASTSFLAIGLTLAVVHMAALPFTGASVNPARSLGSAIVGNAYDDIWLYIVAPLVGGALGWVLYRLVTGKSLQPEMS